MRKLLIIGLILLCNCSPVIASGVIWSQSPNWTSPGAIGSTTPSTGNFTLITNSAEYDNGNSSTADTIAFANGNKQKSTLTGNATLTLTPPLTGVGNLLLRLIQDGTGSRIVTWAASSGSVLWPGGTAPTLTTAANSVDIVTCYWNGTYFYCAATLDMK